MWAYIASPSIDACDSIHQLRYVIILYCALVEPIWKKNYYKHSITEEIAQGEKVISILD